MRDNISSDAGKIAGAARKHTGIPLAVGFGISTPQQARTMALCAEGIIVGSSVVKIIEEHGADSYKAVGEYVKMMKQAANEAGAPCSFFLAGHEKFFHDCNKRQKSRHYINIGAKNAARL